MKAKNTVPAVERAIDILEYLSSRNDSTNIKEISEKLRIPVVSVFRIVKSLERKGYVSNTRQKGRYILGARVISLGNVTLRETNLSQNASSFMYELAGETGQTVQLGIMFKYEVMYIDQIHTSESLTLVMPNRRPFPVNVSAGGKVLAAHLDEEKLKDLLDNVSFQANTGRTIVDTKKFRKELLKIRSQGYAIDDEEFAQGIRCIAAPIFDARAQNIASLGITGHIQEITDERMKSMVQQTVAAASRISKALEHRQRD